MLKIRAMVRKLQKNKTLLPLVGTSFAQYWLATVGLHLKNAKTLLFIERNPRFSLSVTMELCSTSQQQRGKRASL